MGTPAPKSRIKPERSCWNKIQHNSLDEAEEEAKRQEEDFKSPMSAYKCIHCHFWHTGNTPKWMLLDEEHGVFQDEEDE